MKPIAINKAKNVIPAPNEFIISLRLLGSFLTNNDKARYCLLLLILKESMVKIIAMIIIKEPSN